MPKPKSKRRRWILLVLLLLAGGGGYYWWSRSKEVKPIYIQVEKATRRDITETVVATGRIHPVTKVVINPEVAGEIVELPVKEGQLVKKGELLLRIKQDNYLASRNSAQAIHNSSLANMRLSQANLAKAKADFQRAEALRRGKLISEAEHLAQKTALEVAEASSQSAQHNSEQAKAALARAEEDLSKTTIMAPIDGTVTQLKSEKGERVVGTSLMSGTEIMTVAQLDAMEARVDVGEIDVVLIKPGQKARLEVDAFRGESFTGLVSEIANASNNARMSNASGGSGNPGSSAASSQDATKFEVRIRVEGQQAFRPGMSVTAHIETRSKKGVLSIPIQSVTSRATNKPGEEKAPAGVAQTERPRKAAQEVSKVQEIVFINEGDKVRSANVKRGISDDNYIEIEEGLSEGQEVVTGSYRALSRDLKDGSLVKIGTDPELAKGSPPKP